MSTTIQSKNASIQKIAYEYEIRKSMAERLRKLRDYEIVIVCDDSSSMNETINNTQRTRWDALSDIVKIVLKIGVLFDSNGVDIYFLNREPFLKVKEAQVINETFKIPPQGYAPLVPVLSNIFQSSLARRGRDKKLLVFVATDGESTDEDGNPNVEELEYLLKNVRNVDTTHVSFLLCTDNSTSIKQLNEWDCTMQNIDVIDDFHREREKVRQYQGKQYPFSRGDYIVNALVGAIDPKIDALNEPN